MPLTAVRLRLRGGLGRRSPPQRPPRTAGGLLRLPFVLLAVAPRPEAGQHWRDVVSRLAEIPRQRQTGRSLVAGSRAHPGRDRLERAPLALSQRYPVS